MFFKSALLVALLALPAAFAKVDNGLYRIINAQSGTTVRVYRPEETLFVSNTLEFPGPFELFEITEGKDGGQFIKNLGLKAPVVAKAEEGARVVATLQGVEWTSWQISSAGSNQYTIQVVNKDLLWIAETPVVPRGDVHLENANGSPAQRWVLQAIDLQVEDKTETETEAEKVGHILGQVLSQVGHDLLQH